MISRAFDGVHGAGFVQRKGHPSRCQKQTPTMEPNGMSVPPTTPEKTTFSQPRAQENDLPPAPAGMNRIVRASHLKEMKEIGRPIVMVTAYDAPTAALADEAGVDVLLVGDSLGQVVHGMDTTLPVTMDMMVMHTQAVARGARRPLLVTDMPFNSAQGERQAALDNAARLIQEGGAAAVKIETCNERIIESVKFIDEAGIPVMGHIGLTPQSIHALGGYKVQGRGNDKARRLLHLAKMVEEAGAFALVLELMPHELAQRISEAVSIPTIGIGAGNACDGQVLVINDLIGLTNRPPRFVKQYGNMRQMMQDSISQYTDEVRHRTFPAKEHQFD